MTTLEPRPPYTPAELATLYPPILKLEQVQVVLRHGERSPVSTRFENTGLPNYWAYCSIARQMKSIVSSDAASWDVMLWKRKVETLGNKDLPIVARGPGGEGDNICLPGETTDLGRKTTYALGTRLRRLYIDQLNFMPSTLTSTSNLYLRATPIPRALDAVQQSFTGMYPPAYRSTTLPAPVIHLRATSEENLFDNDHNCRRYSILYKAFQKRAADRWNDTPEMAYVDKLIGKWMPSGAEGRQKVAIDSHPRLSGIMDTVNATRAHGPATKLPKEFYDAKLLESVDKMVVDEWFAGYEESQEFRKLGKGQMAGDVAGRLLGAALTGGGDRALKFSMAGAHDTTLAGFLSAMGAFKGQNWPKFTSHIAIELFKAADAGTPSPAPPTKDILPTRKGWFTSLFSSIPPIQSNPQQPTDCSIRKPYSELSPTDQAKLKDYYVRIRYNDAPVVIPGCRKPGRHLVAPGVKEEDGVAFCTLEAFKRICDAFTPKDWRDECNRGLGEGFVIGERELAGFYENERE